MQAGELDNLLQLARLQQLSLNCWAASIHMRLIDSPASSAVIHNTTSSDSPCPPRLVLLTRIRGIVPFPGHRSLISTPRGELRAGSGLRAGFWPREETKETLSAALKHEDSRSNPALYSLATRACEAGDP